ncbi:hypothetical protein [Pseudorhodoferax sp. Leaf267]|uniref:hypothetical protein n=1 Tax=Pseudorhodoferax sp. Leaf267 TaxID=1736316 RepID=UPI0006F264DB|nr:hypothetical protein [Pseudorhodoferax sp. Leaf267]KQP22470.1 hypothetical protein ASF43_00620 [Pseudorhodoferax sp. Leaf267]
MFSNTSGVALLAAMASASSYAAPDAEALANASASLQRAGEDIRNARVELYCDHRHDAVAAIRRATHALEDAPRAIDPAALASLDEAVWEARHDHTDAAVAALDAAILRLHA